MSGKSYHMFSITGFGPGMISVSHHCT